MAKKEDTKKEIVEEKKKTVTVNLDKNKLERTKTFSRILYILVRIEKVFMALGVIGMAILMVATPVVVKNVSVDGKVINAFGQKISYKDDGDTIGLYFGNVEIETLTNEEKVGFDYAVKELANTNIAKVFGFFEFALVGGIAMLVIMYIILNYLAKLFSSFFTNNTPFTNDNLEYLQRIAKLTLITVIISFSFELLSTIIFSSSMISFSISSLVLVLVLYVITYIFEYACMLQKKSKAIMFSDTEE